jgi:pSer/pThr/pTyr-binding forkhead associated (FHA) protein
MKVELIVLDGVHKGRPIPLPETIFLIGRDKQCHLRPHCRLVSQLHCAIAAWAGMVRVRDLKSRNGTFLNGQRIHGETTVEHGDELKLGSLRFGFRVENDGRPTGSEIQNDHELEWLLDSEAGSDFPINQTAVGSKQSDSAEPAGSKSVFAGKHLHDYVDQHKRRS